MFVVAPKVWVDNQIVGAPLGHNVEIECFIEASPKTVTYWQRVGQNPPLIIKSSDHRRIVVEEEELGYKTVNRLRIAQFSSEDAGTYKCRSINAVGDHEVAIRIYGISHHYSTKIIEIFRVSTIVINLLQKILKLLSLLGRRRWK